MRSAPVRHPSKGGPVGGPWRVRHHGLRARPSGEAANNSGSRRPSISSRMSKRTIAHDDYIRLLIIIPGDIGSIAVDADRAAMDLARRAPLDSRPMRAACPGPDPACLPVEDRLPGLATHVAAAKGYLASIDLSPCLIVERSRLRVLLSPRLPRPRATFPRLLLGFRMVGPPLSHPRGSFRVHRQAAFSDVPAVARRPG